MKGMIIVLNLWSVGGTQLQLVSADQSRIAFCAAISGSFPRPNDNNNLQAAALNSRKRALGLRNGYSKVPIQTLIPCQRALISNSSSSVKKAYSNQASATYTF